MTCKDCIHYEACKYLYEIHGDGLSGDSYICDCFKDRSKFIELPCKVDKTIWVDLSAFASVPIDELLAYKVYYISVFRGGLFDDVKIVLRRGEHKLSFDNLEHFKYLIGRNLFFTKEEAEQALRERKNETR